MKYDAAECNNVTEACGTAECGEAVRYDRTAEEHREAVQYDETAERSEVVDRSEAVVRIRGKGVSAGIAAGRFAWLRKEPPKAEYRKAEDPETEWNRYLSAREETVRQLRELTDRAEREADRGAAGIFEAHSVMAEDPEFETAVRTGIREQGLSAEAAVEAAGSMYAEMLLAVDDAYMRARAADVSDVAGRMVSVLRHVHMRERPPEMECAEPVLRRVPEEPESGAAAPKDALSLPVILGAEDLTPGETMQLDRTRVLGFITAGGSETGHTAILARTMGIPAVIGVGDALRPEYSGCEVVMDGFSGEIVLNPDEETRRDFQERQRKYRENREFLLSLKGKPSVTKSGRSIRVCCNVSSPADMPAALANDADGIGLFRSECLFLNREEAPSEDEQFEAYRSVLEAAGGKEVVIRTLDIGADKRVGYLNLPEEANPALGCRGLRLCLSRPELFCTQLRALYRASAYGRLCIMFPMVTSVWEVREAKKICAQVRAELEAENRAPEAEAGRSGEAEEIAGRNGGAEEIAAGSGGAANPGFGRDVPVGIMIETPAAALISDALAEEVDFFSFGTNDLTQYTLACDRQCAGPEDRFYNPRHPAVLKLLETAAAGARRAGIRTFVCGELASDPELTEFFLSIHIDELSVSPQEVLPLRARIRELE